MESDKKITPTEETELNISQELDRILSEAESTNEVKQLSFESLLYDSDDSVEDSDTQPDNYADFLAEYRQIISGNLSAAKELHASHSVTKDNTEEQNEQTPNDDEFDESDILVSLPEFLSQKSDHSTTSGEIKLWDKEVSLSTDSDGENDDSDLLLSPDEARLAEEKYDDEIPYSIGYSDDEEVQLSFNFTNEDDGRYDEFDEELDEDVEDGIAKYDPDKPRVIDWVYDIAELLIVTFAAVILLTTFVFKHSVVEGDSMYDTLENGDHLIISDLFYTPERGDIVVFEDYSTALKKAVIKRVIGLPGDTVEIRDNGDGIFRLYVNGEEVVEDKDYAHTPLTSTGVWTVGDDEIFVMGDNRMFSTDSRDYRVGPVKIDSILGKALIRFYPFEKFGAID